MKLARFTRGWRALETKLPKSQLCLRFLSRFLVCLFVMPYLVYLWSCLVVRVFSLEWSTPFFTSSSAFNRVGYAFTALDCLTSL